MTGPEHYAQAERLLAGAAQGMDTFSGELGKSIRTNAEMSTAMTIVDAAIARAQVHATLALAAATVERAA